MSAPKNGVTYGGWLVKMHVRPSLGYHTRTGLWLGVRFSSPVKFNCLQFTSYNPFVYTCNFL